jgi:hypothetical protein
MYLLSFENFPLKVFSEYWSGPIRQMATFISLFSSRVAQSVTLGPSVA